MSVTHAGIARCSVYIVLYHRRHITPLVEQTEIHFPKLFEELTDFTIISANDGFEF
jgi:hypothetical protein